MATVLQISDTHLRAAPHTPSDKDPDATLAASIDSVRSVDPDLVLLTGDLADDGSVAALQRLRDMVAVFSAPILAVAGNHDDVANVSRVFGSELVELGAWRVVAADTVIPGEIHGSIDADRLARRLDALDGRPTVVAVHHPPRSPSTHPWFRLIGTEQLLASLHARPHVRAVVSGHLHEVFRYRESDLELCGAPSTYYAIEHHGDSYSLEVGGLVGTQLLTLGDDGSFACEPVARSLGC